MYPFSFFTKNGLFLIELMKYGEIYYIIINNKIKTIKMDKYMTIFNFLILIVKEN